MLRGYKGNGRAFGLGQVFRLNGEAAEAFAGGGEYGVAYCWRYYWEAGLAYAGGIFFAHYYVDFDFGHVFHAGHVVVVEIGLNHAATVDGDGVFGHCG